jgi:hypothetical protein
MPIVFSTIELDLMVAVAVGSKPYRLTPVPFPLIVLVVIATSPYSESPPYAGLRTRCPGRGDACDPD